MNTMKKCSTCGTLYSGDLCPKCMAGFAQNPTAATQPPEDLPLKPGQSFHGMEVLELLGKGGMGVVYKARQPALDRLVALKILPAKFAQDPDFQNRFIREAKALGSLNHPNIVAVYDFGAEGGLFFFAMEFVDGTNLRQVLRDRKLTSDQALRLVPQLCDALEYAHEEGVVHRDIKPENILLDRKGRVKIADFGLAKLVGADVAAAGALTMTNMVMGTPHYMAPEQVENPKSVDHRADIYSIGVVFYEMLTGELPIGRFEVPSKKVQIDVRLDDVVLKALEKAPDRRYQKASDVKEAVTRATSVGTTDAYSATIVTPVPARKGTRRVLLAMGAVAAVSMLVAIVAVITRPKLPAPVQPATALVAAPVAPPAPEPVDLTKLYFGPEERPLHHVLLTGDRERPKSLPRIPYTARDRAELEHVVTFLNDMGLPNLSPSELTQAYVASWWGCSLIALDSPSAERLEREFAQSKIECRWSHRQGSLLVLILAGRRDNRDLLNSLVAMVQRKLGIAVAAPEVPLDLLVFDKPELPSGWTPVDLKMGEAEYSSGFAGPEGFVVIHLQVSLSRTLETAALREAQEKAQAASIPAVMWDVLRAGRAVATLRLTSENISPFTQMAERLRKWMGLPAAPFETLVLKTAEMPKGYALDKAEGDVKTIVRDLGIPEIQASEVTHAWRATFKPAGTVLLFEIPESGARNRFEGALGHKGPAWTHDGFLFSVQGPDDETLDALENRLREKIGWDRKPPRTIHLLQARLVPADLPPGLALLDEAIDRLTYSCQIKGSQFTLQYRVQETNNYGLIEKIVKELPYRAGDVLLVKDTVIALLSGPEAAWPVLDQMEAILRKKMRMAPATVEEYAITPRDLPKGSIFLSGAHGYTPNPQLLPGAGKDVIGSWRGCIDPSLTLVDLDELVDAPHAAAQAAGDRTLFAQEGPQKPLKGTVFTRGRFVGRVRQTEKLDEAAFEAISEILRAKFRLPR